MPTTTPDSIYYPDAATQITPLESVFGTLAASVQTAITDVRNDLAPQQITDTGWTLTGLAVATGYTGLADSQGRTTGLKGGIRQWGQFVELRFRVTKGTGTITAGSNGNIGDSICANITNTALRPSGTIYALFDYGPGLGSGAVRIGTDGAVTLTDFYPGGKIDAGNQIQIDAVYLLG